MHLVRLACRAAAVLALAGCASKTIIPNVAETAASDPAAPALVGEATTADSAAADGHDREGSSLFAAGQLDRNSLVEAVLQRNPSLAAAHAAWGAARARPGQVRAFDDPMFGYGVAPLSIGSSKVDFGEQVDLSQRLPWPGKRRTRGEVAEREAEARWHDYETARLDLALAAVDLFDDYYLVARALEINDAHVRLLEDFKRAATAQYAAGLLSQQDPLQAEVELAHLEHREVELVTQKRVTVARLNALLHRAPGTPLPPPPAMLSFAASWEPSAELRDEAAIGFEELAVASHPEVAAAAAEVRAREAEVRLAAFEAYPDFGVATSYNSMWGDDEHRWMVGFNLNLPIWRDRIQAVRSEARARLLEAEARRRAVEDEVRSSVRQIFEGLHEAHHILALYRNRLLPAARDQVRAARAGVDTGTDSFLSLIMAERNLRDVELGNEEAIAAVDRRLAELARAVGRLPDDSAGFLQEIAGGPAATPGEAEAREGALQ
jgi:outer membrane protein TolC